MAQVYGPLMSESARGQFGEIVIFQEYHGKTYAKGYGKPNWTTHPPTEAQLAVQAMNKSLMEAWPAIAAVDKATWDALAIPDRVSRVNSYLKENFKRLRSGLPATDFWPAIELPPYPLTVGYDTLIPDPDCQGDYEQIEDYNGYHAYQRSPDAAFSIWYDTGNNRWVIAAQAPGALPDDYWSSTALDQLYGATGMYDGNPRPVLN